MIYFKSSTAFVQSATSLKDKITKTQAIIAALMTAAENAAGNSDLTEYSLDDGQTKISCMYRSADEILAAIKSWETLLQMYLNQAGPRTIRLMDEKNFTRRNGNC